MKLSIKNLILSVLLTFSLTTCSSDDEVSKESIIGSWNVKHLSVQDYYVETSKTEIKDNNFPYGSNVWTFKENGLMSVTGKDIEGWTRIEETDYKEYILDDKTSKLICQHIQNDLEPAIYKVDKLSEELLIISIKYNVLIVGSGEITRNKTIEFEKISK